MKTKLVNPLRHIKSCFNRQLLFLAFSTAGVNCINAQTATGVCTVIQQPCNGNGVLAVVITSGLTPPLTFNYYDSNWQTYTHANVNALTDTLKGITRPITSVYVSDGNGYYREDTVRMVPPFSFDKPVITNAICPNLTGSIGITINGGTNPASVQWFRHINGGPGTTAGTANPINLPPGNYSALITDANGCYLYFGDDSSNFTIQNISPITFSVSATNASCTNGSASVGNPSGGLAPYTYQWSNGANGSSITNLVKGSYTVTVTDAQGCYNSNSTYVNQVPHVYVNTTPTPATCLQNDGKVISFGAGGTPPYTYQYSNGTTGQTANGLSGNTSITVRTTDAKGCIGDGYAYIGTSTPITVTYTSVQSSCKAPTGSASLIINGGTAPYTVEWGTYPKQTGISINNLQSGEYSFKVTDAVGCMQSGIAFIPTESRIDANAYSINSVCPATTGEVTAYASGTHPPFTFLWNTGNTTSSVSNVPNGSYSCIITDNAGCKATKYTYVYQTSPIHIGISTTPASCMYSSDGSSHANPVGGTAPYTYQWSDGQTTPTATNLKSGHYYVSIVDANGCTQVTPPSSGCSCFGPHPFDTYTFVGFDSTNNSCYCTIKGKVYADQNNNCQFDNGEQGIEHIMIHCSGFGYGFSDANGDYSFNVPSGNYTLSESIQHSYPLASCQSNIIPVNVTASAGCTSIVNFANNITPIHDLHILKTCMSPPIPGNMYYDKLIVQNDGTLNESDIQLGYGHDGQLQYIASSPIVRTQLSPVSDPNWYSVNSGFPSLKPGKSTLLITDYLVPTNIPLGTLVNFWDTATSAAPMTTWLDDYTPWNNLENYQDIVVSSYDPNFKEVSPKGTGAEGYIATTDSILDYVIHFQNTGSYYAQNVILIDTLDKNLDWKSLRPGYSDYSYTADITEDGVLKFTFKNINLDWESHNDINSRGFVAYSIKQKPNLSPGTTIENAAAIYFDYNAPVITNTTLNTIQISAGIHETSSAFTNVMAYPNPFSKITTITYSIKQDAMVELNVIDLLGKKVATVDSGKKTSGDHTTQWNAENIAPGIYLLRLNVNNEVSTKKLILTE